MFAAPALAAVVGAAFAVAVAYAYSARRRPHQAAWAIALALFAAASACETAGAGLGWSDLSYRGYYLFGGILNVGWLAAGTVLLLAPGRGGRIAVFAMAAVTAAGFVAVALSKTDPALLRAAVPPRGALTGPAVPLAPLVNVVGSVVLIGGAALSAWRAMRSGAPASLVAGTALIAAGAFAVAAGHSVAQARGAYLLQPLSEAIGICVMFAGYLAVESKRRPRAPGAA